MFVNVFGQAPETWDDDQSGVLCLRNPIIGGRVQQATILHHAQTRLWHLWFDLITWWRICAELDWTRIVSLETTRWANWKEFVGIGRQCAFPEIWLETLFPTLFIQVFGRNISVIVTAVHHSSLTIWELPSTQEVFVFLSTQLPFSLGKIGGSTDFNWHWTALGHFAQRGVVQSIARPGN